MTTFVKVNGMGALRRVGVTTVVKVKVPRGGGLQSWREGLQRRWFDNNCQSQRGGEPSERGGGLTSVAKVRVWKMVGVGEGVLTTVVKVKGWGGGRPSKGLVCQRLSKSRGVEHTHNQTTQKLKKISGLPYSGHLAIRRFKKSCCI